MIPILCDYSTQISDYESEAIIGNLTEITNCNVKAVLNSEYELSLSVLVSDPLTKYIKPGRVILAKPNYQDDPQIFVISSMSYSENEIRVNAEHIKNLFFNNAILADNTGTPFLYTGLTETVVNSLLTDEVVLPNYFTFHSNVDNTISVDVGTADKNMGEVFTNSKDGIIAQTKGEFKFDNFDIYFNKHVGRLTPENVIRYGTNLSSYSQELSSENEYTHVLGYADVPVVSSYNGDIRSVRLYSGVRNNCLVPIPNAVSDYTRILSVDFTEKFKNKNGYINPDPPHSGYAETRAKIKQYTQNYANSHKSLGSPSANVKVDYQNALYDFEKPALGDQVWVIYEPLNYKKIHRITEINFDVVNEKVTSLVISAGKRVYSLYEFLKGNAAPITDLYNIEGA